MRLIDYQAAIDRYHAEYKKQDICDGSEDRDWLKRCFDEAPTIDAVPAEAIEHLKSEAAEAIEQLEAELEMERNKRIKIQYDGHEYTISEICKRLAHGQWLPVDEKNDAFDCSKCDIMVHKRLNYCPNCGAKMDAEGCRMKGCKNCTAGDGEFTILLEKWGEDDFCPKCGRPLKGVEINEA